MVREELRQIPPINSIVSLIAQRVPALDSSPHVTRIARRIQDDIRASVSGNPESSVDVALNAAIESLSGLFARLRLGKVLNGTGIVVHTNLGRAAVSDRTADAMREAAGNAVSLEIDPVTGRRGGRMQEISSLAALLTGADSTIVVNNNAGAVLLTLTVLATGKQVAVSRAEAVEIGGGFRVPDVLAQSGATLVEVGTTNRTYASDYRRALEQGAAVVLKIHASNFTISGFVAAPATGELRHAADSTGALLIEDLGSGTLVSTEDYGIEHEPTIQESISAGVDVVTYSGDKLLGGPQAGLISGRKDVIDRIASHPLARALRADKTALAGIAETLRHYLRGDYESTIPVWTAMAVTEEALQARGIALASALEPDTQQLSVVTTTNHVGGGALPGQALPGWALRIHCRTSGEATNMAAALRMTSPVPVYGRVDDNGVLIELRTIAAEDDVLLAETIRTVLATAR